MYIGALFITAKTWKQPRCSSVGKWINGGTSRQRHIIQHEKEMSLQAMKRYEEM